MQFQQGRAYPSVWWSGNETRISVGDSSIFSHTLIDSNACSSEVEHKQLTFGGVTGSEYCTLAFRKPSVDVQSETIEQERQ